MTSSTEAALRALSVKYGVDFGTLVELFQERAGVRENMGGFSRAEASRLAITDVEGICKRSVMS